MSNFFHVFMSKKIQKYVEFLHISPHLKVDLHKSEKKGNFGCRIYFCGQNRLKKERRKSIFTVIDTMLWFCCHVNIKHMDKKRKETQDS